MCEQSNDTHCRKCDSEHISQCAECYDGYYMPSDDPEKKFVRNVLLKIAINALEQVILKNVSSVNCINTQFTKMEQLKNVVIAIKEKEINV